VQKGERRVLIHGDLDRKYFKFAYRAPSVSSPDFAAFLLTQELLSGGSGINFLQNDWGTPARPGSALGGITGDLATWFPPSEQEYVFTIGGTLPADGDQAELESAIDAGIDGLRETFRINAPGAGEVLGQARARVLRELAFDVQTTEDAAHQLAFFTGLGALQVLTGLPQALNAVSTADIGRILDQYLDKEHRVVGWYLPSGVTKSGRATAQAREFPAVEPQAVEAGPAAKTPAAPAWLGRLANGTPVILKQSGASATAMLKVLVPPAGYVLPADVGSDEPAWGLVALNFEVLTDGIGPAIERARGILDTAAPAPGTPEADAGDTGALFEYYQRKLLNLEPPAPARPGAPLLLVVSGDIDPQTVLQQLEAGFGDLPAGAWQVPGAAGPALPVEVEARLLHPVAQELLGYVVRVSGPRPQTAAAWQVALYILSHGYEGRLGKEAIGRQGLVYYIDSAYQTDGGNDWIVLQMGVDPAKMPAMERVLKAQLERLLTDPPSRQEIEEAKAHLLGRFISAAQSNQELADDLARQWIWYREILSVEEWAQQLAAVQREDVLGLLPEFTRGSIIKIRSPDQ
jgi:predicted Zn-dependent peptidase